MRGPSLILVFFFTLSLCLFSHHLPLVSISSSLPTHLSTPSFPLSLSSILPSFIILKVIYSIPSTCPLFPFFFFFFCIWDGEGCFACHTTFVSPFPSSAGERERGGREKRREKKKKRSGSGGRWMRGAGESKRGRTETKRKDHTASWLNEHGQRMITIEYIMLLLAEAIN